MPVYNPYHPGDLVRWRFDDPKSPPGVVLRIVTLSLQPAVEVWWSDSQLVSSILMDDTELVWSSSTST